MKMLRQTPCRAGVVIAVALAASTPVISIFAQQPAAPSGTVAPAPAAAPATPAVPAAPVAPPQGSSMVKLGDEWKVISQNPDTPYSIKNSGVTNSNTDAVTLLLSAVNPAHAASISLYSTRFAQNTASASAGESGIEAEAAQFQQAVLMQGYVPSAVVIDRLTIAGRQIIKLDITAKNGVGEERIFTDVAVVNATPGTNNYHLYAARPSGDAAAGTDVEGIIKSLNLPESKPDPTQNPGVAASATNPQPAAQVSNNPSVLEAAPPSAVAAQIVQDYHGALVMVEGNKGVGSGFLCKMDGRNYVVTNAHVLADNSGVKITNLDGAAFSTGSSAVAVGHDIVKLETAPAPKAFEIMTDIQNNAKIGDMVMIPGNAEGARVVRPVEGKIVGIGPTLIEVDAPFVKGNSGSPIIHEATGKVLGVATYLIQRSVNPQGNGAAPQANGAGPVIVETRRFGYRIDSVKQWQPINWQAFYQESAQVSAIEDVSEDFVTMIKSGNKLDQGDYKSPAMVRAVRSFLEDVQHLKGNGSKADRDAALHNFFADLRSVAHNDITTFKSQPSYDYFYRDVVDEARFRDELYDNLTRAMESQ